MYDIVSSWKVVTHVFAVTKQTSKELRTGEFCESKRVRRRLINELFMVECVYLYGDFLAFITAIDLASLRLNQTVNT